MRAIVSGAGVVGVSQAWYLAEAGFDVTLIDKAEGPGLETSFANGGQISACHTQPWASPAILRQLVECVGKKDAPLLVHPWRWDPALWRWGLNFLGNCADGAFWRNMERAIRPALYSRMLLKELRARTALEYRSRSLGILKIYRSPEAFNGGLKAMDAVRAWGLEQRAFSPDDCVALEPALGAVRTTLSGGIFSPDDESGDACQFTTALADRLRDRGCRLLFGTTARGFERDGRRVTRVLTDKGDVEGDVFVLAAGVHSPRLGRSLGLRLPVYPVKGYSITLPVGKSGSNAPFVSVTDEERRMVYSRLGTDLRAAGTAEFAGFDMRLSDDRVALIRREVKELWPKAGNLDMSRSWCGLRPTTPDNAPILGLATGFENFFLNTGHGTLGWTQACGCGRVIADLASGRIPEISLEGLGPDRFSF